jgi:hypothetical protein
MTYPHDKPFVMCETATGNAVCVVIDGARVKFHDSEADVFPGPVIAEYAVSTFTGTEPSGARFALDLGRPETHIEPETFGVVWSWVRDESAVAA